MPLKALSGACHCICGCFCPESQSPRQDSYPGFNTQVYYNGWLMTLEELGNYTFGYIGAAAGFQDFTLIAGSWYAAGFPIDGSEFDNEIEDWGFVLQGYEVYHGR